MAWPTDAVVTGDFITAAQLNGLPVRIANVTLSADAANMEFTSIPSHYAHLLVEVYARTAEAIAFSSLVLRLNGYSGASDYDWQRLWGSGASATAAETLATSYISAGLLPGNTAAANLFGAVTIEIPHYAQATNQKTVVTSGATKTGTSTGNLAVIAHGGWLRNNEAISTITLISPSGDLKSGSRATLYGMA